MNERTARLRRESLDAAPRISSERAQLLTAFYGEQSGRHSRPVMRALAFQYLCCQLGPATNDDSIGLLQCGFESFDAEFRMSGAFRTRKRLKL